jgi:hypothetical protein
MLLLNKNRHLEEPLEIILTAALQMKYRVKSPKAPLALCNHIAQSHRIDWPTNNLHQQFTKPFIYWLGCLPFEYTGLARKP